MQNMTDKLSIVLVGNGAIADYVVERVQSIAGVSVEALLCRESSVEKARNFAGDRFPVFTTVAQLEPKPMLLVDCAGHPGLISHAPAALESGIDVISISTGALAQPGLVDKLQSCATTGNATIKFLSGAVGGIDVLTSAATGELSQVVYKGRKPPRSWLGSPAETTCDLHNLIEPVVHFKGSAREAARLYPKNANVAATIALASVGLDQVAVELIADPHIDKNRHEIEAIGSFGRLHIRIEGSSLPANPKSSALAAMSIVRELQSRVSRIVI